MKKQLPWAMTITRAVNGYVLSFDEELVSESDEGVYTTKFISVEDPEHGDELITAQKLLWEVMEHFAIYKGIEVRLTSDTDGEQ